MLGSLSSKACSTIIRATDFQTSGWLTVLPLVCHQFDLSPQQFYDALSLQYHRPLEMMLSLCDGCGSYFSISHALDSRKCGPVSQHHNKVRDALGDLVTLVYRVGICEPILQESGDGVFFL